MDLIKGQGQGAEEGNLFEATRTCVWLKLDVCSMLVRFTTQQRDTILINHQAKYFVKANSACTIFLHRMHGRFIVYQFKTVSLLSNQDCTDTKRIPSSSSFVTAPSSTTRLDQRVPNRLLRSHFPAHFFPLIPLSRPFSVGNPDPTHFAKTFLR